jgi:hypothetical protein
MPRGSPRKAVTITIDPIVHQQMAELLRTLPGSPSFSGFVEDMTREVDAGKLNTPKGALSVLAKLNVLAGEANRVYHNQLEDIANLFAKEVETLNIEQPKKPSKPKSPKKAK